MPAARVPPSHDAPVPPAAEFAAAVPPLPPAADVDPASWRGPTEESNWVIPGRLLVGAYPASVYDDVNTRILCGILQLGVTTFVCLQQEYEHEGVKEFEWRAGYKLRPYIFDAIQLVDALPRGFFPAAAKPEGLDFVHFPIVDCATAHDSSVLQLARDLVARLARGEVLYVHCWGGHGRTGTVVSIMLGLLYGLPPPETMRWVQFCHDLRVTPMGVESPQTEAQQAQVLRVLAATRAHDAVAQAQAQQASAAAASASAAAAASVQQQQQQLLLQQRRWAAGAGSGEVAGAAHESPASAAAALQPALGTAAAVAADSSAAPTAWRGGRGQQSLDDAVDAAVAAATAAAAAAAGGAYAARAQHRRAPTPLSVARVAAKAASHDARSGGGGAAAAATAAAAAAAFHQASPAPVAAAAAAHTGRPRVTVHEPEPVLARPRMAVTRSDAPARAAPPSSSASSPSPSTAVAQPRTPVPSSYPPPGGQRTLSPPSTLSPPPASSSSRGRVLRARAASDGAAALASLRGHARSDAASWQGAPPPSPHPAAAARAGQFLSPESAAAPTASHSQQPPPPPPPPQPSRHRDGSADGSASPPSDEEPPTTASAVASLLHNSMELLASLRRSRQQGAAGPPASVAAALALPPAAGRPAGGAPPAAAPAHDAAHSPADLERGLHGSAEDDQAVAPPADALSAAHAGLHTGLVGIFRSTFSASPRPAQALALVGSGAHGVSLGAHGAAVSALGEVPAIDAAGSSIRGRTAASTPPAAAALARSGSLPPAALRTSARDLEAAIAAHWGAQQQPASSSPLSSGSGGSRSSWASRTDRVDVRGSGASTPASKAGGSPLYRSSGGASLAARAPRSFSVTAPAAAAPDGASSSSSGSGSSMPGRARLRLSHPTSEALVSALQPRLSRATPDAVAPNHSSAIALPPSLSASPPPDASSALFGEGAGAWGGRGAPSAALRRVSSGSTGGWPPASGQQQCGWPPASGQQQSPQVVAAASAAPTAAGVGASQWSGGSLGSGGLGGGRASGQQQQQQRQQHGARAPLRTPGAGALSPLGLLGGSAADSGWRYNDDNVALAAGTQQQYARLAAEPYTRTPHASSAAASAVARPASGAAPMQQLGQGGRTSALAALEAALAGWTLGSDAARSPQQLPRQQLRPPAPPTGGSGGGGSTGLPKVDSSGSLASQGSQLPTDHPVSHPAQPAAATASGAHLAARAALGGLLPSTIQPGAAGGGRGGGLGRFPRMAQALARTGSLSRLG